MGVELRVDMDTPSAITGTAGDESALTSDDALTQAHMNWSVEYTHALVVLSTRVTDINLEIPELKRDQKYIAQWYAETYGMQEEYAELMQERHMIDNRQLLPS